MNVAPTGAKKQNTFSNKAKVFCEHRRRGFIHNVGRGTLFTIMFFSIIFSLLGTIAVMDTQAFPAYKQMKVEEQYSTLLHNFEYNLNGDINLLEGLYSNLVKRKVLYYRRGADTEKAKEYIQSARNFWHLYGEWRGYPVQLQKVTGYVANHSAPGTLTILDRRLDLLISDFGTEEFSSNLINRLEDLIKLHKKEVNLGFAEFAKVNQGAFIAPKNLADGMMKIGFYAKNENFLQGVQLPSLDRPIPTARDLEAVNSELVKAGHEGYFSYLVVFAVFILIFFVLLLNMRNRYQKKSANLKYKKITKFEKVMDFIKRSNANMVTAEKIKDEYRDLQAKSFNLESYVVLNSQLTGLKEDLEPSISKIEKFEKIRTESNAKLQKLYKSLNLAKNLLDSYRKSESYRNLLKSVNASKDLLATLTEKRTWAEKELLAAKKANSGNRRIQSLEERVALVKGEVDEEQKVLDKAIANLDKAFTANQQKGFERVINKFKAATDLKPRVIQQEIDEIEQDLAKRLAKIDVIMADEEFITLVAEAEKVHAEIKAIEDAAEGDYERILVKFPQAVKKVKHFESLAKPEVKTATAYYQYAITEVQEEINKILGTSFDVDELEEALQGPQKKSWFKFWEKKDQNPSDESLAKA